MSNVNEIAKELLKESKAAVVIGYAEGSMPGKAQTFFARTPEDAGKLTFNKYCTNNLAVYLNKYHKLPRPLAIVLKGCDARSLTVLIQEKQIDRKDVIVIGVPCGGVYDSATGELAHKCNYCNTHNPKLFDYIAGEPVEEKPVDISSRFNKVKELENMSHEERWEFWMKQFDKCVRCYACRQACPLCYCDQCIVDKTQPRWIESSAHPVGNLGWHLIRAFHLAGRCTGCNECERVCHQNIPLSLLNMKMGMEIFNQFGYRAGEDPDAKPVLTDFRMEDNEDFIR